MAESDQARGKRNAGTMPHQKKKETIIPLKPDYVPKPEDDDIVKMTYEKKQHDLKSQVDNVQTRGRQRGFTKQDCQDIVDS